MLLNFEHLKTFYSALKQKMKNFRGNWAQNDPTADDYIKNRPFYSETTKTKVEVLPVTTVVNDTEATLHLPLVKGQTYNITWDGKVYNCVAHEYDSGYLMLGNTAIYNEHGYGGIETDTGDPFVVESAIENTEVWFYLPTDDDGSPHTVSIEILSEDVVVHRLDKKYLPDDIDNDITIYSSSSGWSGDRYWIDIPENVTFDYIRQAIDQGKNVYLNFQYNGYRYVFPVFTDYQSQQFVALGQSLIDPKRQMIIVFTADSLNFEHRGDLYNFNAFAEVEDTVANAVLTTSQTLSTEQQAQARMNIAAAHIADVQDLKQNIENSARLVLNGTWPMKSIIEISELNKFDEFMDITVEYKVTNQTNATVYDCSLLRYQFGREIMPDDYNFYELIFTNASNNSSEFFTYTDRGYDGSAYVWPKKTDSYTLTFDNAVVTQEVYKLIACFCEGVEVIEAVDFLFEHYSEPVSNSNYIVLTDQVNGYEYLLQMMGGNLVSFCKATSIEVTIPPTRTDFFEGEDIDLTGMVLTAICPDGSNRQIENYDYSPKVTAADTTQIDIVYEEGGVTYTTSIQIAIKNLAEALSDFEYTENANGTYTLTGWKEVVDGVARTELIAPNSNKIIV